MADLSATYDETVNGSFKNTQILVFSILRAVICT